MRVAVVGATGTIGRPLVAALAHGHEVTAISRSGREVVGAGVRSSRRRCDDFDAMRAALEGVAVVYHLVHSLGQPEFETLDRAAAHAVAEAAAAQSVRQSSSWAASARRTPISHRICAAAPRPPPSSRRAQFP